MKSKTNISNHGFTVVELLVAMAISGIVMAGVYSVYYSQQKSYVAQSEVAAMQQNIRASMFLLEKAIRMAGYDPTGEAGGGIQTAGTDTIRVTMDYHDGIDNDGDGRTDEPDETGNDDGATDDGGEDLTFKLEDTDGDGDNDLVIKDPTVDPVNFAPVAENIDALNFVYVDESGTTTTTKSEMRSVQISVVARTGRKDPGYTNSTVYTNQQGTTIYTAPGDGYRRKRLTAEVKCRNIDLE